VQRDFRQSRCALGVVPQELVFDPFFTVRETLKLQSGYFGLSNNNAWIDELLHNLGLTDKADTNMRALSGGMKRRVMVAQALVHRPPVIILDEPTAGVDVELRQTLWRFIQQLNQQGHTIVLTTHYLEEAQQLCQRLAMLKQGKIIALESTATLLKQFASLQLMIVCDSEAEYPNVDCPIVSSIVKEGRREVRYRLQHVAQVESVLTHIRLAGRVIHHIETQQADLEDIFLQMMHKA
jgi:ABC-2 type transport system ATP-binding protein